MGFICGLISVALGLIYLKASQAPLSYIVVNICATVLGIASYFVATRLAKTPSRISGNAWYGVAIVFLASSLFGTSVDDVHRWIRVGPLTLQPSLIVLPAMIVTYSRSASLVGTVSLVVTAVVLALQPDRAMAGALAGGALLVALKNRERLTITLAVVATAAFVVTMLRADTLGGMPYVERVLFTSFEVNAVVGIAVLIGALLLPLPRLLNVFGVVWLAMLAAAALGNYPTPVVGYGASAIIGYFLSVALTHPGETRTA